jgi:peptide/nickel transport system ATP-binding protein
MVEAGPTRAILKNPRHPYTRGLLDSVPSRNPRGVDLPQIAGSTPSLLSLAPGCAFAPRCRAASPACTVAPPVEVEQGREIRCHHPHRFAA